MQVHKETIDAIPNALSTRCDPEIEIYGMKGIPVEDMMRHQREQAAKTVFSLWRKQVLQFNSMRFFMSVNHFRSEDSFWGPYYRLKRLFVTVWLHHNEGRPEICNLVGKKSNFDKIFICINETVLTYFSAGSHF